MRNTLLLLLCIHIGLVSTTRAQGPSPAFSVSVSPLAAVNNTFRIELETALGDNTPLLFAAVPHFYNGTTNRYSGSRNLSLEENDTYNGVDNVGGFGGELMLKLFKSYESGSGGHTLLYGAAGFGYHNITLDFSDYTFEGYIRDGLQYYHYARGEHTERIRRTDVFVFGGARLYATRAVFMDFGLGLQYKSPSISSTLFAPRNRPSDVNEFGYKGFAYRLNFTVGVSIFSKDA